MHPRPQPPVSPEPSPPDPLFTPQGRGGDGRSFRAFNPPDLVFGGVGFTGAFPPDTVGDVGPDHYIQMVNGGGSSSRVRIFDKSSGRLADFELDSLAPAGSGACADGSGDPIVLFDGLADRWLLSEFASTGNHLCVYISRSPDPVRGGFFVYDFEVPRFPDYPKYAVWPDAYYVSTNERRPAAYALHRRRMLDGRTAGFQRRTATRLRGFDFQALTPSDLDGPTPPPAGAPNYFIRHRDDEAHNPGLNDPSRDFLEIWEFHVDFANPAGSTFILATTVVMVMWRSQYRNFGSHETLVGNFVTDVDNTDHGGIRWYELRRTATAPWTVFQEGPCPRCRSSLDGQHRHGRAGRYWTRLQCLRPRRLPLHPLHRAPGERSARNPPARRGERSDRLVVSDCGYTLGRLQRHERRPERRLHLLVHRRVRRRRGAVGDPHRALQLFGVYRERPSARAHLPRPAGHGARYRGRRYPRRYRRRRCHRRPGWQRHHRRRRWP